MGSLAACAAALIAVLAGAADSVGLMPREGRRGDERFPLVLIAIWVLSPFMALALADVVSTRWSVLTRATLYSVMLVLTLRRVLRGVDAVAAKKNDPGPG